MKGLICLLSLFGLLFVQSAVRADPLLDYILSPPHPSSASISYAGGTNPLVGANVNASSVVGVGTPANDGTVLTISSGRLNFTTGNFSSFSSNTWTFSGGGSISLTGGIASLGIPNGSTLF